jgi:hypothetical protein
VQPSSAQVRVSPKARTIGSAPAARRLPLRISTTMLGLFPHPSRANAARPRHTPPVGLAVVASCRLPPARILLSCGAGCGGWAGRGPKGSAPPGQVAGCRVPPRARAQRGRRSGPCGRLAVTELLARVGGSSVTANWPCADQGGRHVDMVVGADHRGRAGVGVWRDAAPRPLTARRQRPGHGWRCCWTRPTIWRWGRWVQAQWAQPTTAGWPGRLGYAAGVGASGARPPGAVRCWKAASFALAE